MDITVSKTDYLLFRECPKNTWLKLHKPEIYYKGDLSEFEKAIIETGNEVETKARELFPTGILIEGRDTQAESKTQEYLSSKTTTLFQPVFRKDGFFAAVDLLKLDQKSDKYSIYEIKATNQIKEKSHLYDLAFQVNLLRKTGLDIGTINLLHLNPDYVRSGKLDITKLFVIDDVTDAVGAIIDDVAREMEKALAYLSATNEPAGQCDCVYKGRSNQCSTFSYSNPHIPKYSVHDIARIGVSKAKLTELIDSNIYEVPNVPETIKLSEIQQNQVNTAISGRPIIRTDKIAEELRSLIFPLYFLDYETFPCAIPRFDGFSPYQQVPFQYSLHIVESPNSEPVHREFLYENKDDPSRALIASLMKDIGKIGTVITWNKKFECKINDELAQRQPSAKSFMNDINTRVYDLMDVFTKQYHVHKDYYGSTSIKYVLPVLAPELTYKDLEIREGGTASQKWNEMVNGNITPEEKQQISTNLKKYCGRDTYAMYAIWKHLTEICRD